MLKVATLVVALTAGMGIAAAESNTFHWSGKLAPGQLIEIKGVNGNIRAEASNGTDVEVTAEKSGSRSDPAQVHIEQIDNGNGATICAVYPSKDGRPNECKAGEGGHMNTKNNDVKVEFTVHVPKGVRFTGRTVNGGVQAQRLSAEVEAHTVNGKIIVSTSGAAVADTVNGSIHAILGAGTWSGARNFTTVNGSVEVELPADISAQLDASTVNGRIDSEFAVTVHGRFANRSVHGTLGSGSPGGRELKISTVNGGITLRKV